MSSCPYPIAAFKPAAMKKTLLSLLLSMCIFLGFNLPVNGQMPVSGIIYLGIGGAIYNYNPSLPVSATNPSLNGLPVRPTGSFGLAIFPIPDDPKGAMTFYTVSHLTYWYYDPFANLWTNTHDSVSNVNEVNIGGGGGYIYNRTYDGDVYQYNGTSNDQFLVHVPNTSAPSAPNDLVTDCSGNWYLFNQTGSPAFLNKYSSSGILLQSWTPANPTNIQTTANAGFAILGDTLYTDNIDNNGITRYLLSNTSLTALSTVTLIQGNVYIEDLASFPSDQQGIVSAAIQSSRPVICSGDSITLTAAVVPAATNRIYQWYLNGYLAGTNNATYSYYPSAGDSITVTVSAGNAGTCAVTPPVTSATYRPVVQPVLTSPTVSIVSSPPGNIIEGQTATFYAIFTSGGASPVFQWTVNGVVVPGVTHSVFTTSTLHDSDLISVKIISDAYCITNPVATSSAITVHVLPATAIGSLSQRNDALEIYPTINNGSFTISAAMQDVPAQQVSIQVMNMIGQKVFSAYFIPASPDWKLPVHLDPSVASGVYLIKVTAGGQQATGRITVRR